MKSEKASVKWRGLKFSTSLGGRVIMTVFKDEVGFQMILKRWVERGGLSGWGQIA